MTASKTVVYTNLIEIYADFAAQ